MKKLSLALVCLALICTSCKVNIADKLNPIKTVTESGNVIEKTFNVGMFDEIDVHCSLNVRYLPTTGSCSVKVKCCDNIMDKISVTNNDKTLRLKFKDNVNIRYNTLDITVYAPTLETVWVSGSGMADLSEGLVTDDIKLVVSGSGKIHGMNIKAHEIEAKLSGSGNIKLAEVATDELEAEIGGSGEIALAGLAKEAKYEIAGSGNIDATALIAERGKVNISGSGNVKCNVASLSQNIAGSGKVTNFAK
ncbi:MAG: head GIN domain-containing protein [Prevotellaceae bacterium]|nr:head GIN domain-containing protein [Prevotellaceae bacterium]